MQQDQCIDPPIDTMHQVVVKDNRAENTEIEKKTTIYLKIKSQQFER